MTCDFSQNCTFLGILENSAISGKIRMQNIIRTLMMMGKKLNLFILTLKERECSPDYYTQSRPFESGWQVPLYLSRPRFVSKKVRIFIPIIRCRDLLRLQAVPPLAFAAVFLPPTTMWICTITILCRCLSDYLNQYYIYIFK